MISPADVNTWLESRSMSKIHTATIFCFFLTGFRFVVVSRSRACFQKYIYGKPSKTPRRVTRVGRRRRRESLKIPPSSSQVNRSKAFVHSHSESLMINRLFALSLESNFQPCRKKITIFRNYIFTRWIVTRRISRFIIIIASSLFLLEKKSQWTRSPNWTTYETSVLYQWSWMDRNVKISLQWEHHNNACTEQMLIRSKLFKIHLGYKKKYYLDTLRKKSDQTICLHS